MEYAPGHRLWSTCDVCGKHTYTKKDAKLARKQCRDAARCVYQCEPGSDRWHFGRLPDAVKRGEQTRDEYYGRSA